MKYVSERQDHAGLLQGTPGATSRVLWRRGHVVHNRVVHRLDYADGAAVVIGGIYLS